MHTQTRYFSFIILIVLALFVIGTPMTFAQEQKPTSPTKTPEVGTLRDKAVGKRVELRDKAEELREEAESKTEERRSALEERRSILKEKRTEEAIERERKFEERKAKLLAKSHKRITAFVERMTKRMNAAVERLEKITNRIQSRIDKFTERGVDTLEAETKLTKARGSIEQAKEDIETMSTTILDAISAENPRAGYKVAKDFIRTAVGSIKVAHADLVEAIRALKGAVRTDKEKSDDSDSDEE